MPFDMMKKLLNKRQNNIVNRLKFSPCSLKHPSTYINSKLRQMDSGVRQLIWNGSLPLEIHINDPENILTSPKNTNNLPFYVKSSPKSDY